MRFKRIVVTPFSFAVPLIIIANTFVFIFWLFANMEDPNSFMVRHFLVSWQSVEDGRLWTLLTSAFSHYLFFHFFLNMYVLKSFGGIVERVLGFRSFVRFYLVAGIFSSLAHAVVSQWILNEPEMKALGASGAVAGVIILFALLFPKEKILVLGLIPIRALTGVLVLVGLDLWGLVAQAGGHGLPIGHGAHLGGALTGALYYFMVLRERFRPPYIDVKPI